MSLLFKVLYAAHAKGTHHKLAFDGLARLDGTTGETWRRLFLKHAEGMMVGAKAPDDTFKDFKNHVLHPRDNFWGGAPIKAREWYGTLVRSLREGDWPAAAYAAGVLSHYVTDPIQPFHTGQSEAENNIHRALEWSTAKSYEQLKRIANADATAAVTIPDAANWLEQLLCQCATISNRHYEKLIAHYDIHRGVVDPPSGLDSIAQKILGEMIGLASAVYAGVLQRAITESGATPPNVELGMDTVLATLKIPIKVLAKRLADEQDRKTIERMYDELKATGTVETHLPDDDRSVRNLYVAEVLSTRPKADLAALFPHQPEAIAAATALSAKATAPTPAMKRDPVVGEPPSPRVVPAPTVSALPAEIEDKPASDTPTPIAKGTAAPSGGLIARLQSSAVTPLESRSSSAPRLYLAPTSDIVDAPSIGPVMAERLIPMGLKTVADLLAADAKHTADKLALRYVSEDTVRDWQAQARLVCSVPGLRGTHAQLLVGSGFHTTESIADAPADDLCARLLAFAASQDGQRILRNGDPPDITRITSWIENARSVRAA
jgi:hypothetical protein